MAIAELAELLRETSEHHDPYEKSHAPHNWWDWYAAYMNARQNGGAPEQASDAAGRYMEEVLHVAAL
jgi:hypothetical protein